MRIFIKKTTTSPEKRKSTLPWLAALFLAGLMAVEGFRQGGFWHADALVVTSVSLAVLVVQLTLLRPGPRSWFVMTSLLLLALWWWIRADTAAPVVSFLPLGASVLGFAASFAAVGSLTPRQKSVAGLWAAGLGGLGALIGFAGLIWRWYPMAMPAQHLWRLSTTITYSDAAGVVLAVCLFVALASSPRLWIARVSACLCVGGVAASQSRGALIAFLVACAFVPLRQYLSFLVPLSTGVALGVVAVATSSWTHAVPVLGVTLVAAIAVSLMWIPEVSLPSLSRPGVLVAGVVMLVVLIGTGLYLHSEIALRAFAPSDRDRAVEWSAAFHQFLSSPFVGVGPDRMLHFHATDGTFSYFAHNEYLQVAADSGLVGLALLALIVVSLVRVLRRVDTLTSCAVAAVVCLGVAGAFDFDWHLPFIGLLGGWVAGLGAQRDGFDQIGKLQR